MKNYCKEFIYNSHIYLYTCIGELYIMTRLGEYLARRSVNKSMVARRTGLSKPRINELTLNDTAKLRADELFLIAKAINVDACGMLQELCGHLQLQEE